MARRRWLRQLRRAALPLVEELKRSARELVRRRVAPAMGPSGAELPEVGEPEGPKVKRGQKHR